MVDTGTVYKKKISSDTPQKSKAIKNRSSVDTIDKDKQNTTNLLTTPNQNTGKLTQRK